MILNSSSIQETGSFQLFWILIISVTFGFFMELQPVLRTMKHIEGVSFYGKIQQN